MVPFIVHKWCKTVVLNQWYMYPKGYVPQAQGDRDRHPSLAVKSAWVHQSQYYDKFAVIFKQFCYIPWLVDTNYPESWVNKMSPCSKIHPGLQRKEWVCKCASMSACMFVYFYMCVHVYLHRCVHVIEFVHVSVLDNLHLPQIVLWLIHKSTVCE